MIFFATTALGLLIALAKFAYRKPDQYFVVACVLFFLGFIAVAAAWGGLWAINSYYDELVLIAPDAKAYQEKILSLRTDLSRWRNWVVIGSFGTLAYAYALFGLRFVRLVDSSDS